MTNEEAITTLTMMRVQIEWDYPMEYAVAIDMAIEALRSATDINVATKECSDCIKHGGDWECDHMHCRKGRLPSAQQEIIHCRECKHNSAPITAGNALCDLFYGMTDQFGFCHMGARREDG